MSREQIRSESLSCAQGAESLAVRAEGLVFVSGIGCLASSTSDVFAPRQGVRELEEAFDRAAVILEGLGSALEHAAKVKFSVRDWSVFQPCEQHYRRRLAPRLPACAYAGAQLRDRRAALSIELIAGADRAPVDVVACAPAESHEARVTWGTRLGELVFSNGIFAAGAQTEGGVGRQAETIFAALTASLEAANASFAHVVKVNGTAASWQDFGAYNQIYKQHFQEPYAARASIRGTLPEASALIGVETIASLAPSRVTVESEVPGPWHGSRREKRSDTVYSRQLHPLKGPHSHGVRAGSVIFAAGACPYDAEDRLVGPGDVATQTRATLDNLQVILRALDADLDDIVKTNVTLSNLGDFAAFDAAYAGYFKQPYPARQVVGAGLGQAAMLVEIEAIAIAGAGRHSAALVGVAQ